jgi:hypothetical protein
VGSCAGGTQIVRFVKRKVFAEGGTNIELIPAYILKKFEIKIFSTVFQKLSTTN